MHLSMRASLFLCSLGCVLGAAAFAQAPAPSANVEIHVGDRPALVLSDEDLLNMPRHTVRVTEHDKQISYEGVLLHDVLERAGAPLGSQLRGKALSTYVLAQVVMDMLWCMRCRSSIRHSPIPRSSLLIKVTDSFWQESKAH